MRLSPREQDKLMIYVAAQLATDRKKRGLKLNHPEAVAYLTAAVLEGIRDGKTVAELMTLKTVCARKDVIPGTPGMTSFARQKLRPIGHQFSNGFPIANPLQYSGSEIGNRFGNN